MNGGIRGLQQTIKAIDGSTLSLHLAGCKTDMSTKKPNWAKLLDIFADTIYLQKKRAIRKSKEIQNIPRADGFCWYPLKGYT